MNSIIISSIGQRKTAIATEEIFPGEWVTWGTIEGVVIKQAGSVNVTGMIVIEDSINGRTINDGYAVGDTLQMIAVQNGDLVFTRCDQQLLTGATLVGVDNGLVTPVAKPPVDTFFIGITLDSTTSSAPFWVKIQVAK